MGLSTVVFVVGVELARASTGTKLKEPSCSSKSANRTANRFSLSSNLRQVDHGGHGRHKSAQSCAWRVFFVFLCELYGKTTQKRKGI